MMLAAPMAVFWLVTRNQPDLAAGWAIPAAPDIAFAVGVSAVFKLVQLGVMTGSAIAAISGYAVLRLARPPQQSKP